MKDRTLRDEPTVVAWPVRQIVVPALARVTAGIVAPA